VHTQQRFTAGCRQCKIILVSKQSRWAVQVKFWGIWESSWDMLYCIWLQCPPIPLMWKQEYMSTDAFSIQVTAADVNVPLFTIMGTPWYVNSKGCATSARKKTKCVGTVIVTWYEMRKWLLVKKSWCQHLNCSENVPICSRNIYTPNHHHH